MRLSAFVAALALPSLAFAGHSPASGPQARRHDAIARRASSDVGHLHKRAFNNARFTFYDVGLCVVQFSGVFSPVG